MSSNPSSRASTPVPTISAEELSSSLQTGSAKKKGKKSAEPPTLDGLMARGVIANVEVRPNGRIIANQIEYASLAMAIKAYNEMSQEFLASDPSNMLRMMFLVQMQTTQNAEAEDAILSLADKMMEVNPAGYATLMEECDHVAEALTTYRSRRDMKLQYMKKLVDSWGKTARGRVFIKMVQSSVHLHGMKCLEQLGWIAQRVIPRVGIALYNQTIQTRLRTFNTAKSSGSRMTGLTRTAGLAPCDVKKNQGRNPT